MFAYNSKSVKNRATAVVFSVNYVDCVVEMQRNGGGREYTVRQSFPEPSGFQYSERTIACTETNLTSAKSP